MTDPMETLLDVEGNPHHGMEVSREHIFKVPGITYCNGIYSVGIDGMDARQSSKPDNIRIWTRPYRSVRHEVAWTNLEDCMHHYLHFCWSQMQAPRHLMIQFHRSSVVGPLKVVYHPQLAMLSP
ncbi:hypothetical protein MGG_16757 [Pyricularia oryzae 70-15]|uniref:Uncharacterized protein n=3 Tax=Pyricularia oryzae TaxID=318829 RepID=G4N591_PYRO7|nr:uncharacterized protein MGG_16757 [Pyricularia oryzae 70-15]EHA52149.1 hypothetical protein MGG_16757 [Pyricularia oryzae 70-15]ELQ40028.1 hypothetical protein OOU_Y34scaffold00464g111 [Pyricularia oryzae Y34]